MCLAVPGRVVAIEGEDPLSRMARVDYGGVVKRACLAYVPEAALGDYVIVHAGFALTILDEEEARRSLEDLRALGELQGGPED
jgi:hydrogenase expression/formation protein HypC